MTSSETAEVDFLTAFVETGEELLNGLAELFPTCPKVAKKAKKFKSYLKLPDVLDKQGQVVEKGKVIKLMATRVIREWHETVKNHYDKITNRQVPQLFESKLPFLEELEMAKKWQDPEFGQQSRDNLFQYLDLLDYCAQNYCDPNALDKVPVPVQQPTIDLPETPEISMEMVQSAMQHMQANPLEIDTDAAQQIMQNMGVNPEQMMQGVNPDEMMQRMQSALPPTMLRNIEGVARQLAEQMSSGQTDAKSLDMKMIMSMGQTVMEGTSPEDMMHVMSNMHKIMPLLNMNQMMAQGMPGMAAGADITMMFRMMGRPPQ
jgi:hypothetical protein